MTKPKKNLRYAESAGRRTAGDPANVLNDTVSSSSEREDFPYLPELPSRIDCLGASVFGTLYVLMATAPLWWKYEEFPLLGAMLSGTAVCYGILRGIVHIRWERHCRRCREMERDDMEPVRVKLAYVNRERVRGKRLGYVTPEMICEAARRLEGRR